MTESEQLSQWRKEAEEASLECQTFEATTPETRRQFVDGFVAGRRATQEDMSRLSDKINECERYISYLEDIFEIRNIPFTKREP